MSIAPQLRNLNIDLPACPSTLVKLSLLMADENCSTDQLASLGVNGALWTLAIEAQFYLLLPLLAPAIIIGGMWSGVFTPTEAAAVAALYAW